MEAAIFNVIAAVGNGSRQEQPITIFPNPVGRELKIKNEIPIAIGIKIGTAVAISIYNMLGVLAVQPQTLDLKPETIVDVSHLPPGVYMLKVTSLEKTLFSKFIRK